MCLNVFSEVFPVLVEAFSWFTRRFTYGTHSDVWNPFLVCFKDELKESFEELGLGHNSPVIGKPAPATFVH